MFIGQYDHSIDDKSRITLPVRAGQTFQMSVRSAGRLSEPSEFEDIILKRSPDGALVRVKDVGLDAQTRGAIVGVPLDR